MWDKFSVSTKKTKGQNLRVSTKKTTECRKPIKTCDCTSTFSTTGILHFKFSMARSLHLDFVDIDRYLPTRCGTNFQFPQAKPRNANCPTSLRDISLGGALINFPQWQELKVEGEDKGLRRSARTAALMMDVAGERGGRVRARGGGK
uniref:Uncharacterized protein n=1 Tax=Opuntia streptacantha TaxID=393608 RepID=A0A7C8ZT40_OPUST